jgi:hypothetical protein
VTGTILDNDVAPGTVVRGSIARAQYYKTWHEAFSYIAFAALKSDGSVVTWGDSDRGGDSNSVSSGLTSGLTQIFSAGAALAALISDGSVVTWGSSTRGRNSSSVASQLSSGVVYFADSLSDDRLVPSDTTSVTLTVSPATITEDGATNLLYALTRTSAISNSLSVNYTVSGTATFNSDYSQTGAATFTTTTGTVTFEAGVSTASLSLDPSTDLLLEADETLSLTLLPGTGHSVAASAAASAEDDTSSLICTFTRAGTTTGALTVNYGISGTADSTDYSGATPGPDKTLTALILATGTGYTLGTTAAVTGTITNDGLPTTFTVIASPILPASPGRTRSHQR